MKKKSWLVLAVLLFAAAASLVTCYLAGRRAIRLDSVQINQLTYTICPHTTNHITLTDRQRISEIAEQFNSLNLKSADALSGHMISPDYRLLIFLDDSSTMQLELYAGGERALSTHGWRHKIFLRSD